MWKSYDGIYVIGTNNQKRDAELKANLNACGIHDYSVHVGEKAVVSKKKKSLLQILTYDNMDDLARVIADSHFFIIEQAYNRGHNQIMILEDDARFELPLDTDKVQRIHNWMATNVWDMFYYGHVPWPVVFSIPMGRDVAKVFTPLTSHCYALSRRGMWNLLEHKNRRDVCIDKLYSTLDLLKYASLPSISFQSEEPGLYKQANVPLAFKTSSRILEYLSIIIPVVVVILAGWLLYRIYAKYKKSTQD